MEKDYRSNTGKSKALHDRAGQVLPSGVTYFIRYFEPYPFYVNWAKGSKVRDVDGNTFVDFWMGHYTHILGHSPPNIVRAVKEQIDHGYLFRLIRDFSILRNPLDRYYPRRKGRK